MDGGAFDSVEDVKIKIERLLKSGDYSPSSQTREILKLIYKQVESFEEIAKTTLNTSLDELITSEVYELEKIVDQIGSKSERNEEDEDVDDEDEEEEVEDVDEGDEEDEYADDDDEEEKEDGDGDEEDKDVADGDEEDEDADNGDEEEKEDDDGDEEDENVDDGDEDEEDINNLKKRFQSFNSWLKMEEQRCAHGLYNLIPGVEEDNEDDGGSLSSSKMIGVSDVYQELKDKLMKEQVTALVGMPGIGKTTLAYQIFHDPTVVGCFDHRVWIRVGKKYRVKDIPRCILARVDPYSVLTLPGVDEKAVHDHLKKRLKSMRYFIVLDDVWDRFALIPPSISQLSSLQFLFVDRHQNIRSRRHQVYLPTEIWGLQDLRHLQVMGSDLPDPCGASFKSLTTLSNVSARSCTEAILKGIPSLKVLKIRIELTTNFEGIPLSCFTHISCLCKLEFLKCTIVCPEVVPPVLPFSSFPASHLTSLSLSGLGYSWKEMRKIAPLPNLMLLKLKNYAFQGPEWEVEGGFLELDALVIEDTDMVDWRFVSGAFERLRDLTIKCCYKLEKIRGEFGKFFETVELIDCNPSCVDEMRRAMPTGSNFLVLDVHSSWNDEKPKR